MRVRLKGLNHVRKKLADGTFRDYWYFGKGGPRVEGEFGSPEFIANYCAIVEAGRPKPNADLQSLINRYLKSPEFLRLKERTKQDYRYHLKRIEPEFGDMPISALSERGARTEIVAWRDRMAETAPRQADIAFRVLARIISWAVDLEIAPANPCHNVKRVHHGSRRDKVWSEQEERAFMAEAPKHLQLAFQLGLWTAQRRGDLLRITWADYDGNQIRLTQGKTGARVSVPVEGEIKRLLDEAKREARRRAPDEASHESATILTAANGRPWNIEVFSKVFAKARDKAGIVDRTFHDLRGTCVTRMAASECTVPQIATFTGHSLADVYTILDSNYMSRDPKLARDAVRKLNRYANRPTKHPTARKRR